MEPLLYLTRRGIQRSPLCSSCLRRSLHPGRRTTRTNLRTSVRYTYSTATAASPRSAQANNEETDVDDDSKGPQAYPLGDYYSDILKMPSQPHSRRVRSNIPPPQQQSTSSSSSSSSELPADDPKSRFGIVFGTRLAGPGYTSRYNPQTMPPESMWKTINGVPIPPRPAEPDNCCMSGCVNCVWDDYRDEVEAWAGRVQEAQKRHPEGDTWSSEKAKEKRVGKRKGKGKKDMRQQPREEVDSASTSMDDDGGPGPTSWGTGLTVDDDDLFADIPVGIREFMRTEKRLKERRQDERSESDMV